MTNYALNDEKMFADVTDGIAIIINSETGLYYGMNALGTSVYENLVNGAQTEKVLCALKAVPGAPDNIEEKFNAFIKALVDNEIITETQNSDIDINIDENIAKEDNFTLDIREYNDAQELLLADPIHEVKEETGWSPEKDSIGYSKEETMEREKKTEV